MPDQPTYDARDWQRERDLRDEEEERGETMEEIKERRLDLRISQHLES